MSRDVVVASYNVHRFVGGDGVQDLERVSAVIGELRAEIVALQEVEAGLTLDGGDTQLDRLAKSTGHWAVPGPTLVGHRGDYGNAILTRFPVRTSRRIDLTVGRYEPRGAVEAEMELPGGNLRFVSIHLGLRRSERWLQIRRLFDALPGADAVPRVLLGDWNEWLPRSGVLRALRRKLHAAPGRPTFPARWPAFPLDRAFADRPGILRSFEVHRSPLARVASDHLPVRATLSIGGQPSS